MGKVKLSEKALGHLGVINNARHPGLQQKLLTALFDQLNRSEATLIRGSQHLYRQKLAVDHDEVWHADFRWDYSGMHDFLVVTAVFGSEGAIDRLFEL